MRKREWEGKITAENQTWEGFVTLNKASEYLGIHVMTAYRLAKEKKLPLVKIGGRWLTKLSWMDKLLTP